MNLEHTAYQQVIENLHDGLYFVNRENIITYWNKAAEKISGFKSNEVIGRSCADKILTHVDSNGECLCEDNCYLTACMNDGAPREATVYMHHKDGQRIPVSVRVSPLTNKSGEIIGGIELFTDISNQQANELRVKELEKMALLDHLTQLANRNYIERELAARFEEMKRYNVPFGLLFIDIDHFKSVNDQYGHDVGDKVLQYIARTFVSNARTFDLYGRWGGEEFIGIIRNISAEDLKNLGNRMCSLVANSYVMHEQERLQVTISLGVTLAALDDNIDQLIKRADELLYVSKENGRNRITFG